MIAVSRRVLLAGLAATCLPRSATAQEMPRQRFERKPEYKIFSSLPHSHVLSRLDTTVDERGYRLFRALPKTTPPAAGWPSIWMLDGNSVFDRLQAEDLVKHPGLAVFGVGYAVDQVFDTTARALDYTPVSLDPKPEDNRGRPTGGADAFRARLLGPLREAAEADAPLDPARRTLWGHSYGGLFTLHCLLSAPEAFAGWVPVSPSSGFGGNVLRHMSEKARRLPGGRVAPVRIMLGDSEHRSGTPAPTEPRPAPATMALAEILRQRPDLDLTVTVLQGLGHGQTFTASFSPALTLAAGL